MLRRLFSASRYAVLIAVLGTFVAALALLIYEASVVAAAVVDAVRNYSTSSTAAKKFAVGLIEVFDVFLVAIAVYIISLGLYVLFVDEGLRLPRWLEIRDLDDLNNNLVSVVIAVLAVLFLREAMAWDARYGLLAFRAAVALVIATLTFFLVKKDNATTDLTGTGKPNPIFSQGLPMIGEPACRRAASCGRAHEPVAPGRYRLRISAWRSAARAQPPGHSPADAPRTAAKPASRSSSFANEVTGWLSAWYDDAAASYACRLLARAIGGTAEEVR